MGKFHLDANAHPTASIADGYGSGTKIVRTSTAGPAVARRRRICMTAFSSLVCFRPQADAAEGAGLPTTPSRRLEIEPSLLDGLPEVLPSVHVDLRHRSTHTFAAFFQVHAKAFLQLLPHIVKGVIAGLQYPF